MMTRARIDPLERAQAIYRGRHSWNNQRTEEQNDEADAAFVKAIDVLIATVRRAAACEVLHVVKERITAGIEDNSLAGATGEVRAVIDELLADLSASPAPQQEDKKNDLGATPQRSGEAGSIESDLRQAEWLEMYARDVQREIDSKDPQPVAMFTASPSFKDALLAGASALRRPMLTITHPEIESFMSNAVRELRSGGNQGAEQETVTPSVAHSAPKDSTNALAAVTDETHTDHDYALNKKLEADYGPPKKSDSGLD